MNHIERLVIKKWEGSASKEELKKLDELLAALSEEERQAYKKLEVFWKSEGTGSPKVNQVQLWNRLENFIDKDQEDFSGSKEEKGIVIPFFNFKIFSVAASIIALLIAGYFVWNTQYLSLNKQNAQVEETKIIEKANKAGEKSTLKLPDGSVVILNSNSKLFIPEKFVGGSRTVRLEGEAYFDIVSNPNMPFVVNTNGAEVKVLGTAFNLKDFAEGEQIVLNVVEGKVKFSDVNKQSDLLVTAQEAAVLNTSTGKIQSINFNIDALAWSKGELVFKSATFQEIVTRLEAWYGVEIESKRELTFKNGFTGRYKDASLKEVLTGISFSVAFDFEINGKHVVIK